MRRTIAALLTASAGALLCATAGAADIKESLGPIDYRPSPRLFRRTVAGILAVGFVGVACYFLYRRRRRQRAPGMVSVPELPDAELEGLGSGEFYARLLAAVRRMLDRKSGQPAHALTPRELAAPEAGVAPDEPTREQWRALCDRAERAQYAGAEVEASRRTEDVALVRNLLGRLAAEREAGERST
ncbi:MAG: hypothetical protein PVJ27_10035 [Candidatus Brocadiaceae bacterium]|jgi:hypothetical protein